MFKIYKQYIKFKLLSILKDMLIHHMNEKKLYDERQKEWKCKMFTGKCGTKKMFEKQQKEQIKWSYEQWLMNHYKCEVVSDIIKKINDL